MIEVKNLNKSFGDLHVLKDISFKAESNEIIAIIGPSGSGKTTLLRCLNLLEKPETGTINIDGDVINVETASEKTITEFRKNFSMVFQQFNLFANKTAKENIMSGLVTPRGVDKDKAEKIALKLLEQVGLLSFKDYYPSKLSGGQKQRIGIARALAVDPKIILFDEPTSALDPERVSDILSLIKETSKSNDNGTIIVTHEIGFANDIADTIIFMVDGKIIEMGPPSKVLRDPSEERTKQFLRETYKQAENLFVI